MNIEKRPRVLLIAELADADMVSVPLVGWSHSQALSKVADVHIVTQIRHRNSFLNQGLIEGVDFTAIDSEAIARPLHKFGELLSGGSNKGWTTKMAVSLPSYYYFEYLLWKKLKSRLLSGEFDLVHRLTPLTPSKPSIIVNKCYKYSIPFIWGPISGGLPWPAGFNTERKKENEWLSSIRDVYKLFPGYRASRKKASALIIASINTWNQIPTKYRDKCIYLPENAIDPKRFSAEKDKSKLITAPIKLVFVGRLVPLKCVDILLEATSELVKMGKVTIDIIGDGPEMSKLRSIADDFNLQHGVKFHGNIPHIQVQDILVNCDVLAFPSIREFGGGVVLEAMALGLVPVVVNYGGPPELLTPETGVIVELGNREQLVERFKDAIIKLIQTPESIENMGKLAKSRVYEKFTWDAKAEMMLEVYLWVLGENKVKPNFGMPLN